MAVGAHRAHARADGTRRVYQSEWISFEAWAAVARIVALPATPQTVATYLAWMADAGSSAATIAGHAAAIRERHRSAGLPVPTDDPHVQETLAGIRRVIGTRSNRKAPVDADALHKMLATLGSDVAAHRDRAVILVGYEGAFRRSELVALDVESITWRSDHARILISRSKTDQEGEGRYKVLRASCAALRDWLQIAKIDAGPVFRGVTKSGSVRETRLTAGSVARIVKATARAAGLNDKTFSGHSLRAGFVTEALRRKSPRDQIRAQTGHRRDETLDIYDREGNPEKRIEDVDVGIDDEDDA